IDAGGLKRGAHSRAGRAMSLDAAPTLAELAAQPARVDDLAPEQARAVLVAIAALQPLLIARAMAPAASATSAEPDRLLTVAEAAARLAVPESYLYELIRQGRVPAQRIGPKYVRLHPMTVVNIQQRGLDAGLSGPYSCRQHDGSGARHAAGQAEANAGRVRGA